MIIEKYKNIRLDKYLSRKFPQYSRAFLKSQINAVNILVNGEIKKPSYILKENDNLKINIISPQKSLLKPNPDIKLNIVYEDKNIIAIDKPAGISVHPSKAGQNDTITNALLAYYPAIAKVSDPSTDLGQTELRPGIVHRLDKDTSGLMVIAKNQKSFNWLKEQFVNRKVVKKYLALASGSIKEKKGVITKPIGKTKDFRKRTTITIKDKKEAETQYMVLKHLIETPSTRFAGARRARRASSGNKILLPEQGRKAAASKAIQHYTLLEVEPKTGRTHQIRVHLASIGHPIAGDVLYGFKRQTPLPGLKRQFLHASYLKFSLPNGKIIELKSELPKDLNAILTELTNN